MRRIIPVLVAGLVAALAAGTAAQSFDQLLEEAQEARAAGEMGLAIQKVRAALRVLQAEQDSRLPGLFPAPPEGWTADDPEISRVSADQTDITTVTRTYSRDERKVVVTWVRSPEIADSYREMLDAMRAMTSLPRGAGPGKIEILEREAGGGWITFADGGEATIMLFAGAVAVTVEGETECARILADRLDLAAIQAEFPG